jgi:hypothetical protein
MRSGLNADGDHILALANQHANLRKMAGHADWADDKTYLASPLSLNSSTGGLPTDGRGSAGARLPAEVFAILQAVAEPRRDP